MGQLEARVSTKENTSKSSSHTVKQHLNSLGMEAPSIQTSQAPSGENYIKNCI